MKPSPSIPESWRAITDDQSGIAFDGDNSVAYTLTFSEAVQAIDADDLTVTGATIDSVDHTAGSKTATVTVTVTDDSMANVLDHAKPSIVDIAGNPLVQAVDDSQTVDTRNPSTEGAKVSDVLITDADANGDGGPSTLSVSFTFNEAMDRHCSYCDL